MYLHLHRMMQSHRRVHGLGAQAGTITEDGRACDHVELSLERAGLPRATADGPVPGSASSWRYAPQSTMTVQVTVTLQVLGVLVCLWLLHRVFWTILTLTSKLRQLDEECRRLKEQLSAVRTVRRQRGECPCCASPLPKQNWHTEPMIIAERSNDDLST